MTSAKPPSVMPYTHFDCSFVPTHSSAALADCTVYVAGRLP
ncbi:MAG: hypothetical protein QOI34_506, partial [Verrucomicrobiota bacterium]